MKLTDHSLCRKEGDKMKKLLPQILKGLKLISEFVFYFLLICGMCIYYSVKYIAKGENKILRGGLILLYPGLAAAYIFLKPVIGVILIIFAAAVALAAIFTMSHVWEKWPAGAADAKNEFFEGMTLDDAKREYHRLMKKYHPDNCGGDSDMAKRIAASYEQYRSRYAGM
jgi:hypothetical protein